MTNEQFEILGIRAGWHYCGRSCGDHYCIYNTVLSKTISSMRIILSILCGVCIFIVSHALAFAYIDYLKRTGGVVLANEILLAKCLLPAMLGFFAYSTVMLLTKEK